MGERLAFSSGEWVKLDDGMEMGSRIALSIEKADTK